MNTPENCHKKYGKILDVFIKGSNQALSARDLATFSGIRYEYATYALKYKRENDLVNYVMRGSKYLYSPKTPSGEELAARRPKNPERKAKQIIRKNVTKAKLGKMTRILLAGVEAIATIIVASVLPLPWIAAAIYLLSL